MKKNFIYQVFAAILVGILAGYFAGTSVSLAGVPLVRFFDFIGNLFLNALKLIVVPLVAASIITGAARVGGDDAFKALGIKTMLCFIGNLLLAILIGFTFASLLQPGEGLSAIPAQMNASVLANLEKSAHLDNFDKITQIFFDIVPSNIIAAAAQGKLLGLIFFSMLFGFFINKINNHTSSILLNFWQGVFEIMMKITHLIMRALPLGVFGLVAAVVAKSGLESFISVGWFVFTVLLALTMYGFAALPLALKAVGGVSPAAHFKAVAPALFTAFTTSSSAATLPTTLECLEVNAKVSNRICSFVIPLGTSINLAASALYVCVSVLFIAQAYQAEMTLATQMMVILMSFLLAFGTAAIPSGCLISVLAILQSLGIPAEAVGLLWAVERVLDMYRTSLNVLGNTCCGVLVARLNGEKGVLARHVN
jgi:Na+/H+-dicarboxylate symporter